jgi:hypothetical protein
MQEPEIGQELGNHPDRRVTPDLEFHQMKLLAVRRDRPQVGLGSSPRRPVVARSDAAIKEPQGKLPLKRVHRLDESREFPRPLRLHAELDLDRVLPPTTSGVPSALLSWSVEPRTLRPELSGGAVNRQAIPQSLLERFERNPGATVVLERRAPRRWRAHDLEVQRRVHPAGASEPVSEADQEIGSGRSVLLEVLRELISAEAQAELGSPQAAVDLPFPDVRKPYGAPEELPHRSKNLSVKSSSHGRRSPS